MFEFLRSNRIYLLKIYACYSTMIIEGMIDNSKGVLLPMIKESQNLEYSAYTTMINAMMFGYLIFSLICSTIIYKYGYVWAFLVAFIGPLIGFIGIYFFDNYYVILCCLLIASSGLGGLDVASNSLGSITYNKYIGLMYCLSAMCYGIGAFLAPPYIQLIKYLFPVYTYKEYYLFLLIPIGVVFITVLFIPYNKDDSLFIRHNTSQSLLNTNKNDLKYPIQKPRSISHSLASLSHIDIPEEIEPVTVFEIAALKDEIIPQAIKKKSVLEIVKDSRVWNIALILSFFTIAERSTSNWGVLYATKYLHLSESTASVFFTAFLLIYTFSRIITGAITDKVGYYTMIYVLTTLAIICCILGFSFPQGTTGLYFLAICGGFVSTYWPCCMGLLVKNYKNDSESATALALPVQAVMQIAVNATLGIVNDSFGDQYAFMLSYSMLVLGILMTILLNTLTYLEKKENN